MLFLTSAAVRFHAKPVAECALRSTPKLAHKAKALASELKRLEAKDIKKQLHVNDVLAREYEKCLGDFERQHAVAACRLYDAPFWRGLGADGFERDDADWANRYLRIFSGLYGLLRPFDEIQPLSLPVTIGTKLKNSKGGFLYDYWLDPVTTDVNDIMEKLPMPVIVNCGAEEDMKAVNLELLPAHTRVASIEFKGANKDDQAEWTGEFVRWAIQSRLMTVEDLLEYCGLGADDGEPASFRINPKASKENHLVFEEHKGEDAGGWSKKMQESGMSKKAFVRSEASGKTRFKRTEINKQLDKDQKKARKNSAVY